MNEQHRKVLEETKRFWAVLPELLEKMPGRWVLFKDGLVVADFATKKEARRAGLVTFGLDGGQVIAQVRPNIPVVISAGASYVANHVEQDLFRIKERLDKIEAHQEGH